LDPEGFYSYVRFRYPLGERTFFKGVKTLPPGSILKVNDQAPCLRRFWSVTPQPPFLGDYVDALSVIRDLLEDAVHIQMRSDRSFCTYLSGGLDSSYIALVQRNIGRKLRSL
jgi:asparagine synthase (glutamine-hydrolysing)